ncbi:uncharacterized protein LOC108201771 [Daucus carota subsp. sativus]|nr:PREDICTED: uncharacterized protein LOC108201771 [Daucus carota subsp. sativus]
MLDVMDKMKEILSSLNSKKNGEKEDSGVNIPAMCSFLVQLPEQLSRRLKSQFTRSNKEEDGISGTLTRKHKASSSIVDVSLEEQLRAWKENPFWIQQPPDIKVTVPKGSLSHLNLDVNVGLPPDALFNIVTDPDNKRVFKNIKEVISRKVLVDEGTRQVVEVEQAALWRFLWWSGTISVHVLVDQNREDYTMKFKQLKAGFMKRFEGCWKMEPLLLDTELCHPLKPETVKDYVSYTKGKGRIGSKLSLEQIIEPAIVPPPPISWYIRGITTRTTEMLINDLLAEAARIRGFSSNENTIEHVISEKIYDKCQLDELSDIKERWTMRRKISRQSNKRLLLATKIQG